MHIEEVRTPEQRSTLFTLLYDYEAALPAHLRHGSADAATFARITAPPARAFLAVTADIAFGCVLLAKLDSATAVIQRLFVRESARGTGAGRALVTHTIECAREDGHRRITLDTDATELQAAFRLYQSLGFTPCEPFMPVDYPNPHFMELLL